MVLLDICTSVATEIIPCLACKAWDELRYLRKYKKYVKDFENEQGKLSDEVQSVKIKIEEARKRNESLVDPKVEGWLKRAEELLKQDTKPTKCFGLCMNCCSRVARAKELESWTKENIPNLIAEVHEFDAFARAAGVPGMEYHSQQFKSFESRKENFEKLKKELEDENNYMIGLHGLGGTGKSTMVIEVGKRVEKANPFDKVIFIEVSKPVDEKRIRDEIAKQLELQLEEGKLLSPAQQIYNRIANIEKVLIILDDVWEELSLSSIGIQHGIHSKGRCCVLLTTRSFDVCNSMGCQKILQLDILPMEDARNLFLYHTFRSENDCPDDLKELAEEIVNECGRLPIMIVAVAKAFKSHPPRQWDRALIALKHPMPLGQGNSDEPKREIYNSLRFSYDYLKDKHAHFLFLLCSIFPKAYEIPIELLSRITIGLGLFGEGAQYFIARSHVHKFTNKLLNSSLLLKSREEYVKMHDVIRDMALEAIDDGKIQVIIDSNTKLKEGVKYLSWAINDFSICFDDSKLEILLIWINANKYFCEVPNRVFEGMKSLRVLLLHSKVEYGRTSALSLPTSIQSLENIRTLSLKNWELGDISAVIKNLQKLESLELTNCSVFELPSEISELHELRFLCLMHCSLGENNPFEVIARCSSKLEELYYVSNEDYNRTFAPNDLKITFLQKYQIYHIDGGDFSAFDSSQLDSSIKRIFKPAKLQRIFSKEVIESMAIRAEILELEGDNETGWSNLNPAIMSIEDGAMKDLIKLSLKNWSEMKCLIHNEQFQLKSGETVFPKLSELQLDEVGVKEICCGPYPDGFLKQLEKLELRDCMELESTLFKGELELGNLKSVEIRYCSMTCLFHPSTTQSLRQLETLIIGHCSHLEYIIKDEGSSREEREEEKVGDKDPNPRIHDQMFPKLKLLSVETCEELEFVLPICFCEDLPLLETVEVGGCKKLKYMFGQYPEEQGRLHKMQKEMTLHSFKVMSIEKCPSFINIYPECYLPQKSAASMGEGPKENYKSPSRNASWGPLCCFLPKSKTSNKEESSTSTAAQPNHTASQEKYVGNRAHGIFTPPLYPCKLRMMIIGHISNLRSLFSVSIASSMLLLEDLQVFNCAELENIVKEDGDGRDHITANSIFPNLHAIEVEECNKLEYVFPAACSTNFVHLESVHILRAIKLKYVFGKICGDDNLPHQNQITEIHLQSLKKLSLEGVRNVSMCPENYYVKASSLKGIDLDNCSQLPIKSFIDLSIERHEGQEQHSTKKIIGMDLCNLKHLSLVSLDVETIYDLERLQTRSPVNSSLEYLVLGDLDKLRNISVGPKNLHISFQNLLRLKIYRCNKLKFILSTSILRSLQALTRLSLESCEELERIIEDDDDQECCFPNIVLIAVRKCWKLKCLFSIFACGSLPKLMVLSVEDAPELEQVFVWKQSPTQELDIKRVFPKLFLICLHSLPKLHSICSTIDFRTEVCRSVIDCPKIPFLTSTDFEFIAECADWVESADTGVDPGDLFEQVLDRIREVVEKTAKRDSPTAEQNNAPSYPIEETADEVKDSEQIYNPAPLAAPSQIEVSQSKRGLHLHSKDPQITKPSDFSSNTKSSQETVKPTSQEGSKLDEVALTTNQIMGPESSKSSPTAFVVSSENVCPHDNLVGIEGKGMRITLDHEAIPKTEHDIHTNVDSQKNIEASVGEISDKMAMESPSTATEKSPPLIASISTHKKPQIATSSIEETTSKSSQSDLLDTQDEIRVTQEKSCMPCVSKQFENEDLMILFKIIEEGADMDVHMPYAFEIPTHEYDRELTKALADLETTLKKDLNEIASSEESILFLENALNTLSSYCSDDDLKATVHSLQQEIQTLLSSFKLEQKEKLLIGQSSHRKGAAMTLLSEIHKTQTREAELKEQISKLQTELHSKENEIIECEVKLLSLEEQKKKSVSDTIGFIKELEAVKKERSQLENVGSKWSSCLANLKKTSLLLGVHLKQKL